MATQRVSRAGRPGGWRVVPREINERGDLVYDVFQGDARRAWGIKDEATAQRWLKRLSGRTAAPAPEQPTANGSGAGEPNNDADPADESYVPPRVWWNES